MADYKGIQGYTVQRLASDPPAAIGVGQLWFNSSSNVFKISVQSPGAWSTEASMVTGRYATGGCGTKTAALTVGGYPPAGAPFVGLTEEYNGTAWSEVNNCPKLFSWSGFSGTQTAALYISGGELQPGASIENISYEYDGTSWATGGGRVDPSSPPGLILQRVQGCGTQTAALTTGGQGEPYPGSKTNVTESYDGSSWTKLNDYTANTGDVQIMGTTLAAIAAGGSDPPYTDAVSDWDGTSWTAGTAMNGNRTEFGSSHVGAPSTNCAIFAGSPGSGQTGATEVWNGTTWTEVGDLTTGRQGGTSGGAIGTAFYAGGTPPTTGATESFDNAPIAIKTVTTS